MHTWTENLLPSSLVNGRPKYRNIESFSGPNKMSLSDALDFTSRSSIQPLTHIASTTTQRDASEKAYSLEYQLQQLDHNTQIFISLDADDSKCFAIINRSKTKAWRSKPQISIESISPGSQNEMVSCIRFNPTPGQLPWVPKALVTYAGDGSEDVMEMKYPMSLKWNVSIADMEYIWSVSYYPPSVVLTPRDDFKRTLAVFNWRGSGNRAQSGQEVGMLRVFEKERGDLYRTQILSTAAAVISHWKSMGKFLMG